MEIVVNAIPKLGYDGDVGYDLRLRDDLEIPAGKRKTVKTTLCQIMPIQGFCMVMPKSGLTAAGVDVKPGIIDSRYRNLIGVTVVNNTDQTISMTKGQKVAQLVYVAAVRPSFVVWPEEAILKQEEGQRGLQGFGSTGLD